MAEIGWRQGLLAHEQLTAFHRRSDARGAVQLAGHFAALAASGFLVSRALGTGWLVPALLVHGVLLVFLFAPLHECIHRTAFRRRWPNRAVGWICGALLMLPPLYFRHFHFAHHRWTQDPERDPELATPKPATLGQYLLVVSGLPYWRERLATTLGHACGRFAPNGFLPVTARARIVGEARRLWALYAVVANVALALGSWAPLVYWLAPAILAQPVLRLYLLAEHAGCTQTSNMLFNSRTTLSNALVRRLAWNMPYHIEHHVYSSVPFHALPTLHDEIRDRLGVVAPGYVAVHTGLVRRILQKAKAAA
ncbi:MAG: fatty acid desaturase [Alphaproteobacteria bacterium]